MRAGASRPDLMRSLVPVRVFGEPASALRVRQTASQGQTHRDGAAAPSASASAGDPRDDDHPGLRPCAYLDGAAENAPAPVRLPWRAARQPALLQALPRPVPAERVPFDGRGAAANGLAAVPGGPGAVRHGPARDGDVASRCLRTRPL